MTQAGITEIMAVGKVYREFIDFFTDPMRILGKFGKNLDKCVGERHTGNCEHKTKLLQNDQQCPKLNGKSESCNVYLINRILI